MDSRLEERYYVIKLSDLDPLQRRDLDFLMDDLDIPTRDSVVIEADWPMYDAVVNMIFEEENGT